MIKINDIVLDGKATDTGSRKMPEMTDEEKDIIKHFGVMGMHWGTKKGKAITKVVNKSQGTGFTSGFKATGKMVKNLSKHPIITTGTALKNEVVHPVLYGTSPITLTKKINMDTENNIKESKHNKESLKYFKKELKETKPQVKELRKIQKKEGNTYYNYMRYNDANDYLTAVKSKVKKLKKTPTKISKIGLSQSSLLEEKDIIKHFGVMGMHWGTKKGKAITKVVNKSQGTGFTSGFKATGKMVKNLSKHPIITTGTALKNEVVHPVLYGTSPITLTKKINMDTENNIKESKHNKESLKYFKKELKETKPQVKELRKIQKKEGNTYYNYMRYNDANDYLTAVKSKVKKLKKTPTKISKIGLSQSSLLEEKDIIKHFGVMGMHWGKGRKTKVANTVLANKPKTVDEYAREKQFKSEYDNRDKMSTRALQNRVKRLQAEQQFKELVNKPAAERAKAEAAIAEKKRKRNKMLLRTALSIYGNVPMESFGKKGKELKKVLGPSQAIAKAATSSDMLKNSSIGESTDNILLHYGIKGMRRGIRRSIIANGGKKDVKLLKKQNIAAIKIYKANKLNYKVAKRNFKSNRNKINKMQYKAALKMYRGAKVAKKAQMTASKIRSQELAAKYIKQYYNGDVLLHKGVKGMKWGLKNSNSNDTSTNNAVIKQQIDTLNQQIAVEKDPKKKAFLEKELSSYNNANSNSNSETSRTPDQTRDALVKGVETIKQNISKEKDPNKLLSLKKSLSVYNNNIAKLNSQLGS